MLKFLSALFLRVPEIIEVKDDPNIQTSELIKYLSDRFPVDVMGEDLTRLDTSLPPPREETNRRFNLTEYSDESLSWLSTNEILLSNLSVMTFRERLLFERIWFERFGTHPDYKRTATLCAGSPVRPYNNAAMVFWKDDKLNIHWCCPNSKDRYLRARRVLQDES